MDPLRVNFNLPESDLALLHKALAAPRQGAVTLTRDGDPTPIAKRTLDFVDSSVDTASGTIAARASVPNPIFRCGRANMSMSCSMPASCRK